MDVEKEVKGRDRRSRRGGGNDSVGEAERVERRRRHLRKVVTVEGKRRVRSEGGSREEERQGLGVLTS